MAASPLVVLPEDVRGYLFEDPYFTDINIYFLREKEITSMVNGALTGVVTKAGKAGVAVSVLQPVFDVEKPNAAGPELVATLVVRVEEIPVINSSSSGTGKKAEAVAERIAQLLLHLHASRYYSALYPAKDFITPVNRFTQTGQPESPAKVAYEIAFRAMMPLAALAKAQGVTITPNGGPVGSNVTMAAGAGASIYYSSDESFPGPLGGPASTEYTAPFVQGAAGTIRAIAVQVGKRPSDMSAAVFA
jgi:hypothetical protein